MSSSADILQVAVVLRVVCLLFLLCFEQVVRLLLLPKAVPLLSTRFYCFTKNNETSSPGLLGSHTFSGDYPVLLTFYSGYLKHLPNLFNTSWLFRINRGIWANQKRRYILKESNDNDASVLRKSLLRTSRKAHSLLFCYFLYNYLQVNLTLQPKL